MKLYKKFFLTVSILGFLVLGVFAGNYYLSPRNTYSYIDAPNPIFAGGNITTYSSQADAIIIGKVRNVSDPYVTKESNLSVQQDALIDIEEVLKGEFKSEQITVNDLGLFFKEGYFVEKGVESMKDKYALLKPDEQVLLFLGTNNFGQYVVFGGPHGKYLIDDQNNVTSIKESKMSLEDLRNKIQEALKNPIPRNIKSKEIWEEE